MNLEYILNLLSYTYYKNSHIFQLVFSSSTFYTYLSCFHPKAFTYSQNLKFEDKSHHKYSFPKTLIIKKEFIKHTRSFILLFKNPC
jgi:hypothetical protein